jgi:enamine deaminase RidA (YjgF/YER057c/UK114 family)
VANTRRSRLTCRYSPNELFCKSIFSFAPAFAHILSDKVERVVHSDDAFAPVCYLRILEFHLEPKNREYISLECDAAPAAPHLLPSPCTPPHDIAPASTHITRAGAYFCAAARSESTSQNDLTLFHNVIESLKRALDAEHTSMSSIFSMNVFVADLSVFAQMNRIYSSYFPGSKPPCRATVQADLACRVFIEAIGAAQSDADDVLWVQSISRWAPACIGPYSQARRIGNVWHLAGMIALHPPSMRIEVENAEQQLQVCLRNIDAVLHAIGSNRSRVVLVRLFACKWDVQLVGILRAWCGEKTLVSFVECGALPRGALVEVQPVALHEESEIVFSRDQGAKILRAGDLLFACANTSDSASVFARVVASHSNARLLWSRVHSPDRCENALRSPRPHTELCAVLE